MATIVTRAGKGSPLTNTEMDANLTNLNAVTPAGGVVAAGSGINGDITQLTALAAVPSNITNAIRALYPVGSIYISTVSTNPNTLFGFGLWVTFGVGQVAVGAGAGWAAGSSGGSADAAVISHTHAFAGDAMAAHSHTITPPGDNVGYVGGNGAGGYSGGQNLTSASGTSAVSAGTPSGTNAVPVGSVAGTGKNMPPYIVVYMWNRTA